MERKQWAKYYTSKEETYSQGKKLPVTGRKIHYSKKPPITGKNLMLQEETYSQGKKLPGTGINLPSQEETSFHTKKHLKIDILMDEHNAEEEIEIAKNVPLLQNAYKIFKNAINPFGKTVKWRLALCKKTSGANNQQK
jgi:hypothetical protein